MTFSCGHPRVPENTNPNNGGRNGRCRSCHLASMRLSWATRQECRRAQQVASVLANQLTANEAIALYRAEKAKRTDSKAPLLEAAKKQLEQMMADAKRSPRVGRTKGSKNGARYDFASLRNDE